MQDHLLQWTATRNPLFWWSKETFQGLSGGQFGQEPKNLAADESGWRSVQHLETNWI